MFKDENHEEKEDLHDNEVKGHEMGGHEDEGQATHEGHGHDENALFEPEVI